MLGPVLNLTQTAQDATGTTFSWDPVALADAYAVSLDGTLVATVTGTSAKIVAPVGNHTVGVAPMANPTPPTTLPFTVSAGVPATPTGLAAASITSSGAIFSWNLVAGATSYTLVQDGVPLPPVPANQFMGQTTGSLALTDLTPLKAYSFEIFASNAGGNSPPSAPIAVTTTGGPLTPTGLTAKQAGTATAPAVALNWNASAGASFYRLQRDGVLLIGGLTTLDYVDTTAVAGQTYHYAVNAHNSAGSSAFSAPVAITVSGGGGTPPPVPTGLAASGTTATGTTLKWNPSTGATSYTVFEGGSALTPDVTSGTTLTVSGLTPATAYQFTVRANGPGGSSAQSSPPVSVTTLPAGTPPPVPTGLAASGTTASGTTLKWNPSTGATGYVIQESGGATLPASGTTLNVTGLSPSTMYQFAVAAVGPGGQSAFSPTISVTTLPSGGGGGFLSDVVIIMEENEAASNWLNPANAPYLNGTLVPKGALALPLNTCHPSQPNYIAVIGGTNYGCNADSPQPWNAVPATAKSLIDLLEAKGIPYWFLMESLGGSLYAVKHDPFVQFPANRNSPARMAKHVAYSDSFWSTWTGGYVFVAPNLTNDGHTPGGAAGITNADNWLKRVVPLILASAPFTRAGSKAVLNISTDESEGSGGSGCVPGYAPPFMSLWVGPGAKVGYKAATTTYQSHYSELATIEAGLGTGNLGQNDATAPVMRELFP